MNRTRLSRSQSKSFARTRRERRVWAIGLAVVVLLAWVFVLSRLSWLGAFEIANVQVYGADPEIVPALRAAALSELEGSYLGLFARANAALYPKGAIAAAVMSAAPRVLGVDIHHAGVRGLTVTVSERAPAAVVCAELPDFSSDPAEDSNCYLADADGLIFEGASTSSQAVASRYYVPSLADSDPTDGSAPSVVGAYATSTDEFARLQSFSDGVRAAGLKTAGILMKDGGEYELYVENPGAGAATSTDSGADIAVVYFNDAASFAGELSDLVAFWNKEASQGRAAGKTPRFESIDLRYGSNVFYRLEK